MPPTDYRPPSADHEPHRVLIARDQLVDDARDHRVVPIKVYYPVNHGLTGLPVILWSHGLGGSVDGASFLSRFLASHGYVIVHVQHAGTDSGLWEGKKGHPWDIIRQTHIPREATLNRMADIPFVVNQLPEWMKAHEDIACHADLSTLGMSGHSFGALTTQVMCGQMFPDQAGKLMSYAEPRFKAGILYSPVPIAHMALDDPRDIYGAINRPLLHMTGTDDASPIEHFGYEHRLVVYEHAPAPKYLFTLKDGDHMVYNGSRGKLGASANRDKHEALIKIMALAYWDYQLKGDAGAGEWLTGGAIGPYLGDDGTFEYES